MDPVQRLLAADACRETILRAAAAADANHPADFAALFTEDAVLERPNAEPIVGRAAIHATYARRPADRLTRHLVTNSVLEFDGEDEVRVTSLVLLWAGSTNDTGGPHGRPAESRQVVGEFLDRLLRTPEGWRIAQRKATFVLFTGG